MKKAILFLTITSLLLALCSVLVSTEKITCNKNSNKRIDALLSKILTFGDSGRAFPEVDSDIPKYCNESLEMIKSLENYVKQCTKSVSKQVFSVYVFTIKSNIRQLCRKDSKRRREFIAATKCVNSAKPVFQQCINKTVEIVQSITKVEDNTKWIPMLCCEFHSHKQCYNEGVKDYSDCTESHLDAVNRFTDSFSGNSLNVVCGEYADSSDNCDKLTKPPKIKNWIKYKSFFIPTIEVMSMLPEN